MAVLGPESTILVRAVSPLTVSDANLFIQQLTQCSDNSQRNAPHETDSESDPHLVVPWKVRNKYYTADVQLCVLDNDEAHEREPALSAPVVVVLTSSQESPSTMLKADLEKLNSRDPEFDVSLLVTLPSRPLPSSPDFSSPPAISTPITTSQAPIKDEDWDDLALDNGFEWIDLSSTDENETNGEGMDRIRDALQSHLWEGMSRNPKDAVPNRSNGGNGAVRKENGRTEFGGSEGEDYDELEDPDDDEELSSLGAPPLPEPRPYIPPKLSFPSTFLPSIPRKTALSPPSSSSASPDTSTQKQSNSSGPKMEESDSFEDDFSPFVEAFSSSSSSFPTSFPVTSSSGSTNPSIEPFSTTSAKTRPSHFETEETGPTEESLDTLDNLFEQIRLAREDVLREEETLAAAVGEEGEIDEETVLRRRRERAEKLFEQVLGGGNW
ncbi:hypothetical protein JCM16303_005362 [Sporobolomyces ruberrimus]